MDINRAIVLGKEVLQAEQYDSGTPTYNSPAGYMIVDQFYANDLKTDITKATAIVPFGYIGQNPNDPNDYIVAVRGTEQIVEWVQDALFGAAPCPYNHSYGQTEDGFSDIYSSLQMKPDGSGMALVQYLLALVGGNPAATLTIAGHSLGSAVASLLALDFASRGPHCTLWVYLFACPSAGDEVFAATYNANVPNTWNIAIQQDIVTQMPPTWFIKYTPVQTPFLMNSIGKCAPNMLCHHHIRTYLNLLDAANNPIDPECVYKPGLGTFLLGTLDQGIRDL